MIGPFKVLRLVRKNRQSVPNREFWILGILTVALGILHVFIFYKTSGRFFPDSITYRLALTIILISIFIFTLLYIRGIKLVKKYHLSD